MSEQTTLTVSEQTDSEGTLYVVNIATYSWSALAQLEELFGVLLVRVRREAESDDA